MIKTNHSAAQGGFAPLPAGKYEVFIESGQAKVTAKGSPMINWKLNVRGDVEGQIGGGRKLFTNLVIQENTEGMVQGFLKAAGSPDGAEYADAKALIDFATGRAVRVTVKITQYQGEDRNEIGYFMGSEVGGGKIADPFAQGSGISNVSGDPNAPAEDPFTQSKGPIEINEDDLPF